MSSSTKTDKGAYIKYVEGMGGGGGGGGLTNNLTSTCSITTGSHLSKICFYLFQ